VSGRLCFDPGVIASDIANDYPCSATTTGGLDDQESGGLKGKTPSQGILEL